MSGAGNYITAKPACTLRRVAEITTEPVSWIVDQLVPGGMLTILSGKDKVGKTLLAWEIVKAVTTGTPFIGQFPVSQGPVAFLALDDPECVTLDRTEQLGLREEANLLIGTPLGCLPQDHRFIEELKAKAKEAKAKLIVLDALYLLLNGGAESMNQASAMSYVMRPLNELAEETGAAVVVITHDNKGGADVAGSFVIRAAAKQILRLGAIPHEASKRILKVEGKLAERKDWSFQFQGPGDWKLVDAGAAQLAETRAAVSDWLQQGNHGSAEEIAKATQKRRSDVETVLKLLVQEGMAALTPVKKGLGRPKQEYSWISVPALEVVA